jgi:CheY-like chemotaxis protein
MTRAAALKSQGKGKISATPAPTPKLEEEPTEEEAKAPPGGSSGKASAESKPNKSRKTPKPPQPEETPAPEPEGTPAPSGSEDKPTAAEPPSPEAPKEPEPSEAPEEPSPGSSSLKAADLPPSATLPPTPALLLGTRPDGGEFGGQAVGPAMLELLLRELQNLRANQEKMLRLLGQKPSDTAEASTALEPPEESVLSPVRSRQRKTVLLVDDDAKTREAALAELEQADVPVRAVDDGNEALRMIAEEKPDVIALELALGGDMAGKDVINTLKATMEWVDIPIILWTREPVETQKEARASHGADELVQKKSGAAALVARVITLFRRA